MRRLLEPAQAEYEVKRSRFIAELLPAANQEEARDCLRRQKIRYADATHVVHAFAVGADGGTLGCSDDGEPSGTSGRPALEVLKGSGITNVILTVTRYFGGIKLGTGGLVKAYTEAAQRVVAAARTEDMVPVSQFTLTVPYPCYDVAKRALVAADAIIADETFGATVTVSGRVRTATVQGLAEQFRDMSRGQAVFASAEEAL